MNAELLSLFTASFVTFFVLIDALGVAPVFATLTARGNAAYRRNMAVKSSFVATIIMFSFAFGGAWLMNAMQISIDAFRAAGGALLFLIALDMVFVEGDAVAKLAQLREQAPLHPDTTVVVEGAWDLIQPLRYPFIGAIEASDLPRTVA